MGEVDCRRLASPTFTFDFGLEVIVSNPAPVVKINRNVDDLHTDDRLNRLRVRDWMVAERDRQGINDRILAGRVGHNSTWARGVLTTDTWRVATLQKIMRALGYKVTFNVDIDIVPALSTEPTMAEVYASSANVERQEEAMRVDLCTLGARLRTARGWSAGAVGSLIGQDAGQVATFESGDKPFYLLVSAQRYFRALGGELKIVVVPPTGDPFEAPVGRWLPSEQTTVRVVEADGRVFVWNSGTAGMVSSFDAAEWRVWLETQRG